MSSLHDPYISATPSQISAARSHRERRERLYAASLPAPIALKTPEMTAPLPPIPNEAMEQACEITTPQMYGRVETIQRAVVAYYPTCTFNDITSNRRMLRVVKPRQIAMYLAWLLTNRSLPDLGRRFGGRDHTTVLHSVRKIEHLVMTDPLWAAEVNAIKATIPGAT